MRGQGMRPGNYIPCGGGGGRLTYCPHMRTVTQEARAGAQRKRSLSARAASLASTTQAVDNVLLNEGEIAQTQLEADRGLEAADLEYLRQELTSKGIKSAKVSQPAPVTSARPPRRTTA